MAPRKLTPPTLPTSHLEAIDAAGFEVVSYQNKSIRVALSNGEERNEWLPTDMVNWEKHQLVRFSTDADYAFPGWEPTTGRQFGGRYKAPQAALAWFDWLAKQKAAQ